MPNTTFSTGPASLQPLVQNVRMSQNPSPKTKTYRSEGNNCKEDYKNYSQDRDERHIDSYRYTSDSIWMFDSIGIIEPDASQNRALDGFVKANREKNGGRPREADTMKLWFRRKRSRG